MNPLRTTLFAATLGALALLGCKPDNDASGTSGGTTPTGPICPGADEVRYVSEDPDTCAVIRYTCNPGETGYSDAECGCGCELPDCPEANADFSYVAHDPGTCAAIRYTCEPGFSHWSSACGCGCVKNGTEGAPCGGIMARQCEDGFFCAFDAATQCGSGDQMGTCARRPDACILLYMPVCGCDGSTYSNSCSAAAAGVSVLHDGECVDTAVQQN